MSQSSVPQIQWTPQGPVLPTEEAILEGVLADLNAAFGGKLNITNLQAPQGQIGQTSAAVIGGANDNIAQAVAMADPATAEGVYQDAILALSFLTRLPATPTTIACACLGLAGFTVPQGTTVQDPAGNVYASSAAATFSPTGAATITFVCQATGPIAVPGSLTIAPALAGFDSATVSSGTVGTNAESQQAAEARREAAIAGNSSQMVGSVRGALLQIPVASAYCYDNATNAPVALAGVTVPANSIYVCVQAGLATPAQIAQAIWSKKGGGCGMYGMSTITGSISGNTLTVGATLTGAVAIGQQLFDVTGVLTGNPTITGGSGTSWTINGASQTVASETIYLVANHGVQVQDTSYQTPYPSYVIAYQDALELPLAVTVTLRNTASVPSNALALVQNAVAQAFAGVPLNSNVPTPMPLAIGAQVFALNCAANIAALGTWAQIVSVQIGSTNAAAASTTGSISGNTLTVSSGTGIANGQAVLDLAGNVLPGTVITGGSGTSWTVNNSQTVTSETLYFVAPALSSVTPNVNQMPELNAANVALALV